MRVSDKTSTLFRTNIGISDKNPSQIQQKLARVLYLERKDVTEMQTFLWGSITKPCEQ